MATPFRTTALSAVVVSGLLFTATPALADETEVSAPAVSTSITSSSAPAVPATAETPASEAPVTEAPVAEAPAVPAPVTEAPVADAPATQSPVSESPVAEAPATEVPATEAPASEAPIVEAPVTDAPASEAPASESPATETPAPSQPVVEAPKTEAPGPTQPETPANPTPSKPAADPGKGSGVVVIENPGDVASVDLPPVDELVIVPDFFEVHKDIQAPKGSDKWTTDQWADYFNKPESAKFQNQFFGAYMNSDECAYVDDLTFFFTETNDLAYLNEMYDFLNAHFPNHRGLAEGMFYTVINMLVDGGFLQWEDGAPVTTIPGTPAPSEKPTAPKPPKSEKPVQVPVVKPVPAGSAKDGVKAPIKVVPAGEIKLPAAAPVSEPARVPVNESGKDQLAQTGSSTAVMFGGLGVLLVALGAVFMRSRRRVG